MTVARSLAEFLTQVSYADLPRKPSSTRRCSSRARLPAPPGAPGLRPLRSSVTSPGSMAGRPKPRSGLTRALLPVAEAARVNAVMSDAAASDDSDLRNIVHAGTTLVATSLRHGGAHRRQRPGRAGRHCPGLRGVGAHWRGGYAWLAYQGLSRLPRVDLLPARSLPGGYWGLTRPAWPRPSPCPRPRWVGSGCGEHERGP